MPNNAPQTPAEAEPRIQPGGPARRAAFRFLCRALSRQTSAPVLGPRDMAGLNWLCVAEQANHERVVPNLFAALQSRCWPDGIPADFRDYLSSIHEANTLQNRRIRVQILDLGAILSAAKTPFVLLKGANWLMEAGEDIGDRQLVDIDLALAPDAWQAGLGALAAAGFRAAAPVEFYARHFHHVPLARPRDCVTIELHRHLGWQRHILTAREAIAAAEPLRQAPSIGVMHPMHRFIFGCLHAELQNMAYGAGVFSLRDLLDIQHLRAQKAAALDWQAIAAFARERGIFRYLAGPLHLADKLLGAPIPEPFAGSLRARLHARRCLLQRHLDPERRLGRLAVKFAWILDARRHAYERDCEQDPWPLRQLAIARGRLAAILAAAAGRKRSAALVGETGTAEGNPTR
jgi:hypothetical protein